MIAVSDEESAFKALHASVEMAGASLWYFCETYKDGCEGKCPVYGVCLPLREARKELQKALKKGGIEVG